MNVFDFVKAINEGRNIYDDHTEEVVDKFYNQFIINRTFSFHIDTVLHAYQLNACHDLTNKQHFLYLLNSVKPKKRFKPWAKPETSEDLKLVQKAYEVGRIKAKEILSLLSSEQLDYLKTKIKMDEKHE